MVQVEETRVTSPYLGESGAEYFAWQRVHGERVWMYNKHLWPDFVSMSADVLDFGCGGGYLLTHLPAQKKLGVEINPAARAYAQTLGINTVSSLEEVERETFSLVVSSHSLEHVGSPLDTLRQIGRVLKPGGRLVLFVPLDDWRARNQRRFRSGDRNMHIQTWTPQLLGNLLNLAGFQVDEIKRLNYAWPPLADRLWRVSRVAFKLAAWLAAVTLKRRQIRAIARKTK